ncbi:hypothetical protein EON67_01235 [archaeon]|nr:MAG: hypothetical protein EON67_01235 [archaeon]
MLPEVCACVRVHARRLRLPCVECWRRVSPHRCSTVCLCVLSLSLSLSLSPSFSKIVIIRLLQFVNGSAACPPRSSLHPSHSYAHAHAPLPHALTAVYLPHAATRTYTTHNDCREPRPHCPGKADSEARQRVRAGAGAHACALGTCVAYDVPPPICAI